MSISFVHDVTTEAVNGFRGLGHALEGTGAEVGSMSIVKTAQTEAAKKFYEWALTPGGQQFGLAAKQFQLPSNTQGAERPAHDGPGQNQAHQLRLRQVRRQCRAPPPDRPVGKRDPAKLSVIPRE